jgi:hypothetical protein
MEEPQHGEVKVGLFMLFPFFFQVSPVGLLSAFGTFPRSTIVIIASIWNPVAAGRRFVPCLAGRAENSSNHERRRQMQHL